MTKSQSVCKSELLRLRFRIIKRPNFAVMEKDAEGCFQKRHEAACAPGLWFHNREHKMLVYIPKGHGSIEIYKRILGQPEYSLVLCVGRKNFNQHAAAVLNEAAGRET